jgi:hypothetical protein
MLANLLRLFNNTDTEKENKNKTNKMDERE